MVRKTALEALDEVKHVVEGRRGVRLIDQKGFFPRHDDELKKIKDTPSDIVSGILGFDSNNPGPGKQATTSCPVPGCSTSIVINKISPEPGVTPLPRLASLTA
jgi:hypothetical protein